MRLEFEAGHQIRAGHTFSLVGGTATHEKIIREAVDATQQSGDLRFLHQLVVMLAKDLCS